MEKWGKKRENRIWFCLFEDKRKTNFRNWFINYFQIICLILYGCVFIYIHIYINMCVFTISSVSVLLQFLGFVVVIVRCVRNTKTLVIIYCKVGVGMAELWSLCLITMPLIAFRRRQKLFHRIESKRKTIFLEVNGTDRLRKMKKERENARKMCNRLFNGSCWQSFKISQH